MVQRPDITHRPVNPFVQAVYFLIGGLLLIGAVLMGAVILAFVLGFAIILGIVVYVRVWWLKRKLGKSARRRSERAARQSDDGAAIDVEYSVVEERDDRDRES